MEKDQRYVRITVVKEQKVYISVIDNGLGITIDDQKKLFTMFSRFNIEIAEGSGLGMSIVKKSVEAMGGSILVTSNKNETRFDIELPISSNEEVL